MDTAEKVSPEAARISIWLRFERKKEGPCFLPEIERETGIKVTPALLREGEKTGVFLYSQVHGSFI